jgi:hypothetical protein
MKQLFPDPIFGPARFNRARFVSFRQFVRHDLSVAPAPAQGRPPPAVQAERSSVDIPAEEGIFDLTGARKEGSNTRRGENTTGWNMHP